MILVRPSHLMFDIELLILTNQFCSSNFRNEISELLFRRKIDSTKKYYGNESVSPMHLPDNREKEKRQLFVAKFQAFQQYLKKNLKFESELFLFLKPISGMWAWNKDTQQNKNSWACGALVERTTLERKPRNSQRNTDEEQCQIFRDRERFYCSGSLEDMGRNIGKRAMLSNGLLGRVRKRFTNKNKR